MKKNIAASAALVQEGDSAFKPMTDSSALQPVEAFEQKFTRLGMLQLNATHDSEHDGNIVTYMRLKGLVPPSSAGSQ